MKRLIICVLILMCCATSAFATPPEEIRDDLIDIIDQARLLLTRFYPPVANGSVLYEDTNVRITAIGQPYFEKCWRPGDDYGTIYLDVVIENYMYVDILCTFPKIAVNGWTMDGYGDEVMARKKVKTTIMIGYIAETDLNSAEDIETIEGVLSYVHPETWHTFGESEFYWMFNINDNICNNTKLI